MGTIRSSERSSGLARLGGFFRPAAATRLAQAARWRPAFERLEDRLTPAFDVAILSTGLANMSAATAANVTTFSAIGSGASVGVDDIRAELVAGNDVVIDTGNTGAEAGAISWAGIANLNFDGITGSRSLTLRTTGSLGGGIVVASVIADFDTSFADALVVVLDSTATNGDIVLAASATLRDAAVTANAGSGAIVLAGVIVNAASVTLIGANVAADSISSTGPITITAATAITLADSLGTLEGDILLSGNVVLDGCEQIFAGIDTDGADVTITGSIEGVSAEILTINADDGSVSFGEVGASGQVRRLSIFSEAIAISGDMTLTSADALNPAALNFRGHVTFTGATRTITLTGIATDNVLFNEGLTLAGTDLVVNLADPGSTLRLAGLCDLGADDLTVLGGSLTLDGGNLNQDGILAGTGTVTALAGVFVDRTIAPGGVGTVGTLTIVGDVTFGFSGVLNIDMGVAVDRLNVTGAVTVDSFARLEGQGTLPAATPVTILDASGTLTGAFRDTTVPPLAAPGNFVLGADMVQAGYGAGTLSVQPAAAGPNIVTGATFDGGLFKIALAGGGGAQLLVAQDSAGFVDIVVRNAATRNTLTITVTPNGGQGLVFVGTIVVTGTGIAAIKAGRADVQNVLVTGYLKSLTVHDMFDGRIEAGGAATQLTSIKGHELSNTGIEIGGILNLTATDYQNFVSSIRAARIGTVRTIGDAGIFLPGNFRASIDVTAGSLTGNAVGKVVVAGQLSGVWDLQGTVTSVTARRAEGWQLGTSGASGNHPDLLGNIGTLNVGAAEDLVINSVGRITKLTAVELEDADITAASLGKLLVTGSAALGRAGNLSETSIILTGSFGPGQVALGTARITGGVEDSTIRADNGNVTSFVAGRFRDSQLHVGYLPGGDFASPGVFTGAFRIGTFMTTAQPLTPGQNDPLTTAFRNSQVVAARLGKVRVSSLTTDNGGELFGFKVKDVDANVGSFRIATAPFGPAQNYLPSATGAVVPALAGGLAEQGDFRFFVV